MSNLKAAYTVADQLITRLFDQRQFTSGEILFLSKEFGEKCNLEKSLDKILNLNKNVCIISDSSNTNLCNISNDIAENISQKVRTVYEKTEGLLNLESDYRKKEMELLADIRKERAKVKMDCDKDLQTRLDKLNKSLMEEEFELEKKYSKFEHNLLNK